MDRRDGVLMRCLGQEGGEALGGRTRCGEGGRLVVGVLGVGPKGDGGGEVLM